jgi:Domain of unknown function (DUF5679)
MSKMYCLKCKGPTDTRDAHIVKIMVKGHERHSLTGTCAVCGTKKSRFVSNQVGEGILGSLLGLPGGKIPLLSDIPLLGALF